MSKQTILDFLCLKEYWLDGNEQQLVEDYRQEKWRSTAQHDDETHKCTDSGNNKSHVKSTVKV